MNKLPIAILVSLFVAGPSAAMAADDLMADLPAPPNSQSLGSPKPIHGNGEMARFRSSGGASTVLDAYSKSLSGGGWTVVGGGGGGSSWGGGGGLRATNGVIYLVVSAGGPAGTTFMEVCVWPQKPHNTSCDENNED
jgi:hypothetical protein